MADLEISSTHKPLGATNSSILQFLSLYLLVLAFFILLVTISTFEPVKSDAVMVSLNSAFKSVRPVRTDLTVFTSKSGPIIASEQFMQEVENLFAAALGVTRVETVQPGRVMRVTMDTDSLFDPDSTNIRESQIELVDRMIASLSGRPRGFHFDMEFVIGNRAAPDRTLSLEPTLEMTRAGEFAKQFLARGVPPDAISIGIRQGDPDELVLWFYVRSADEIPALYEKFAGEQEG